MAIELWRGPSELTGEPIVVLASINSDNDKTGDMVQTWILRQDMRPSQAAKHGAHDEAICGDCELRGTNDSPRRCYVNTAFAPNAVWRSWQAAPAELTINDLAALSCRPWRLGAYGDPAAVPFRVWREWLDLCHVTRWTGYTHQWRRCDPQFQHLCMASVGTEAEAREAWSAGWRTYRIGLTPVAKTEIRCPASAEMGYRTTCERCMLCDGTDGKSPKSIVIQPHGSAAKRF